MAYAHVDQATYHIHVYKNYAQNQTNIFSMYMYTQEINFA